MQLANCCLDALEALLDSPPLLASAVLSLVIFAVIALHFYYKNLYSFWPKLGVKGPEPWPVVGNLLEMVLCNRMLKEREWVQKHGKVYGVYHGMRPRLIVADPDVLRQICIKDFDAFPNHELIEFANKFQRNFILFLQDEHWKRVRAMLSPTFTSVKIRRMFRLLHVCADDLIDCFNEQLVGGNDIVNAKSVFSLYTMDAITSCCYGLKLERSVGTIDVKSAASRNELVAIGMKIFETNWVRLMSALTVPKPILRLIGFEVSARDRMQPLADRVEKMIRMRRAAGRKYDDYLQLLLDAKFDEKLTLGEMDQHENHHAGLTEQSLVNDQAQLVSDVQSSATTNGDANSVLSGINKIELTDAEILANAVFLLMVGLETTATLLTHCAYALGFHQDCQEKLYQEISKIDEYSADDKRTPIFDYDKLTACQYLDAVISETLRCLSPVIQLDRISNRDYKIEKYNLLLPKGTKLNLSYYAIMNDPDYWPEPDKFDPERFMPGNKEKIYPGAYCPFGIGPRHCLGMRFSLTESKLALAKVVMQFKFEPAPDTSYPPVPKLTFALNGIKKPEVRMTRRR